MTPPSKPTGKTRKRKQIKVRFVRMCPKYRNAFYVRIAGVVIGLSPFLLSHIFGCQGYIYTIMFLVGFAMFMATLFIEDHRGWCEVCNPSKSKLDRESKMIHKYLFYGSL